MKIFHMPIKLFAILLSVLFASFFYSLPLSAQSLGSCIELDNSAYKAQEEKDFSSAASFYAQAGKCYGAAKEALLYSQNKDDVAKNYFSSNPTLTKDPQSQLIILSNKQQTAVDNGKTNNGKAKFLGLEFGVGFAAVMYNNEIVHEASEVDGVIVADAIKENEAKIVLEFHHLMWGKDTGDKGYGPFAALMVAENDILNGIGLGVLYSIRDKSSTTGTGFSFGAGFMLENDVRQLADGFEVGQPLPDGEPDVRFVEKDEIAPFIFISNNF